MQIDQRPRGRLRLPEPPARGRLADALDLVKYHPDPPHEQPAAGRVAAATILALAGSLVADWLIAAATVALAPSTKGYEHFRFGDYAALTVVGVLAACAGWPIVTRACRAPRWLFSRLAVAVSAVLLLPDVGLLIGHDRVPAVVGLVVMHVAIAVITYCSLTRVAPVEEHAPLA